MHPFRLSALLVGLAASTAAANVVIDQEHVAPETEAYYFDYPGDYMAQTFTMRNSGQIVSIGLQLSEPGTPYPTAPLLIQLTRTNGLGEPDVANVLASFSLSPLGLTHDFSGLPMTNIDFTSQQVQVQAGDQLAIVLSSNDLHYDWNQSIWSDEIAGGKFFVYSPRTFGPRWFWQWSTTNPTLSGDTGYRINVEPLPEPQPMLLTALAAIAFRALTPRRKQPARS